MLSHPVKTVPSLFLLDEPDMTSSSKVIVITAHHTPHHSDPPDAHEFYAALGRLVVAWGRFEGHLNGNLLTILSLRGTHIYASVFLLSGKRV